jgi:dTDP-glucose 4,6-dehydratase
MTVLVTGGAGFIGGNFVLDWLAQGEAHDTGARIVNLDALTYAGNLQTLAPLGSDPRHVFVHGDICDRALVDRLLVEHRPRALIHFAAESHVDRSIHGPGAFIRTNVEGTFTLLEATRAYAFIRLIPLPVPVSKKMLQLYVSGSNSLNVSNSCSSQMYVGSHARLS